MPVIYDLHSHSLASDGTFSPAELVAHAQANGVQVLALTDHDTTDGLAEARQAAEARGIRLVNGVEVSVTWERQTIHIVGLGIDPASIPLREGLARAQAFRDWRAEEIGRRLARAGIPGAYEGARSLARGRIVSRTHFAHFLVAAGRARTVREVFRDYLVRRKPGYVPGDWAGLDEAVGWIRSAGGQAVIAHPARYRMTATRMRRLIGEFRDCGGAALEVVSGSHTPDDVQHMASLSCRFGLLASAGSDYHGPENPWVELGRLPSLPAACTPVWQGWPVQRSA